MALDPRTIPLLLLGGSLLFLWLTRRAWRKKQVVSFSGEIRGRDHYQYYLTLGGYVVGSVALALVAIIQVQKTEGWGQVIGYALALVAMGIVIWQAPRQARRVFTAKRPRLRLRVPLKRNSQPRLQAEAHQWALAAVAMQARVGGQDDDTLAGSPANALKQKAVRRWLAKNWEIDDADELDETLEWLFETGHRAEFAQTVDRLGRMLPEEYDTYLEEVAAGKHGFVDQAEQLEEAHRVLMVRDNLYDIQFMSFLAWDYLRYIHLCRMGFAASWLDEGEAWQGILAAAQVLQSRYESWQEMGESFLHAREFWSIVEMNKDGQAYQQVLRKLLTEPESPWQQLAWNMPLYQTDR